jgi:NADH:ubiquinone oxidoreductase subunit 6 (subunit J)
MMANIGPAVGVLVLAIIVFLLNPSLLGVFYALLVIVGACTIFLLRQMYLDELERNDRE